MRKRLMQLDDAFTTMPEQDRSFRFTAILPEGLGSGYLMFETSGLELSVSLNGEEIYSSAAVLPEGTLGMSSANIPLQEDATGELTVTCTILDNMNTVFRRFYALFPLGQIKPSRCPTPICSGFLQELPQWLFFWQPGCFY